jgi:hypothetical protein
VLDPARHNPGWGYTKIRDALRGLKIEIGRTTVASLLGEAGMEPAPERIRSPKLSPESTERRVRRTFEIAFFTSRLASSFVRSTIAMAGSPRRWLVCNPFDEGTHYKVTRLRHFSPAPTAIPARLVPDLTYYELHAAFTR